MSDLEMVRFKKHLKQIVAGCFQRCYNQKSKAYSSYGGRGIVVSDEFQDKNKFVDFLYQLAREQGLRTLDEYKAHSMSIDRINGMANYERGNIRLISKQQNSAMTTKEKHHALWYKGMKVPLYLVYFDIFKLMALFESEYQNFRKNFSKKMQERKKQKFFRGSPFELLFLSDEFYTLDNKMLLKLFNGVIYYDYRVEPLYFDTKTLKADCPVCNAKQAVEFLFEYHGYTICKECGTKNYLKNNVKTLGDTHISLDAYITEKEYLNENVRNKLSEILKNATQ